MSIRNDRAKTGIQKYSHTSNCHPEDITPKDRPIDRQIRLSFTKTILKQQQQKTKGK